jgi:hypothetical protein
LPNLWAGAEGTKARVHTGRECTFRSKLQRYTFRTGTVGDALAIRFRPGSNPATSISCPPGAARRLQSRILDPHAYIPDACGWAPTRHSRCGRAYAHAVHHIGHYVYAFPMAINIEAWRVGANFGPIVGVHTGIRLVRYRKAGPAFLLLETIAEVFTIAKTTLKDAMKEHEDGHYVEERPEVLRALRTYGFVGNCASKVHLVRISLAEKLLRTFDVDDQARDVLCSLSSTSPPPRPPSSDAPTRWVHLQCISDALQRMPNACWRYVANAVAVCWSALPTNM